VFITGCLACGVLIFPYLWSISIGSYALLFVLGIVLFGVAYSGVNGVWPSLYGEMFSARVRLSGMAIGTQIGFAVAGFAPSVVAAIGTGKSDWLGVSLFTAAVCVVAAIAAATARETYQVPTAELGGKAPAATPSMSTVDG
jgi:MFS family permease